MHIFFICVTIYCHFQHFFVCFINPAALIQFFFSFDFFSFFNFSHHILVLALKETVSS